VWLRYEIAEQKVFVHAPGQRDWLSICIAARDKYGISEFIADPAQPEYIATLRNGGLHVTGAQNAIMPGINVVSAFIGADAWLVDPSCENSLAEVSAFCWKQDKRGEQLKQEPEAGGDHSMDCWRYGAMALARPAARWQSKPPGY